jgi:hypothetical protein
MVVLLKTLHQLLRLCSFVCGRNILNGEKEATAEEAVMVRFRTLSLCFPEGTAENLNEDSMD